jgi:hypothetical protein
MVSTTRAEPPGVTTDATLPFRQLSRAAPVAGAVAGCVLSGLITSTFYALVPAWMQDEGIARETIAMSMLVAVFGGLAFQVPVWPALGPLRPAPRAGRARPGLCGHRRHVGPLGRWFCRPRLLGGFMSTLYPVCVANAATVCRPIGSWQ